MSVVLCLIGPSAGCRGLQPASPELLATLVSASPEAPYVRHRCTVSLEAPALSGTYSAVLIARHGDPALGRFQLLPQVGSKLLDLAFDQNRVSGYFPAADVRLDHERGARAPLPRQLLSFLAASLIEELTPITPARILGVGAMDAKGLREVHLQGALEGCRVVAYVDESGAVRARDFSLRGVSWHGRQDGREQVFSGRAFEWRMGAVSEERIEDPSPELFRLDVRSEARP